MNVKFLLHIVGLLCEFPISAKDASLFDTRLLARPLLAPSAPMVFVIIIAFCRT